MYLTLLLRNSCQAFRCTRIYVYMYVYTHTHSHTHKHTHTHTHTHTHWYIQDFWEIVTKPSEAGWGAPLFIACSVSSSSSSSSRSPRAPAAPGPSPAAAAPKAFWESGFASTCTPPVGQMWDKSGENVGQMWDRWWHLHLYAFWANSCVTSPMYILISYVSLSYVNNNFLCVPYVNNNFLCVLCLRANSCVTCI